MQDLFFVSLQKLSIYARDFFARLLLSDNGNQMKFLVHEIVFCKVMVVDMFRVEIAAFSETFLFAVSSSHAQKLLVRVNKSFFVGSGEKNLFVMFVTFTMI